MGLYDREYYRSSRSSGPGFFSESAIVQIITICTVLFIANLMLQQGPMSPGPINRFLAIARGDALRPYRWFTFLTYGFVHADFQHNFFNMFGLWSFGRLLEQIYSPSKIWQVFLGSLVPASVCQILLALPFYRGGLADMPGLLGASGGVMAIAMVTALHFPNNRVMLFGVVQITIWQLAMLYMAIDLLGVFSSLANQSNVGHIAHLAGGGFGAFYFYYLRRWDNQLSWSSGGRFRARSGRSGSGWISWWKRLWAPKLKAYRPAEKEPEATSELDQDAEVDRILVKIQQQGRESLTPSEQQTLEKASRRYRDRKTRV